MGRRELSSLADDQTFAGHRAFRSASDDLVLVFGPDRAQPSNGLSAGHRHWLDAPGGGLPECSIDQRAVFQQDQTVFGRHLEHARGPQHPPGIVTAEDGPQETGFLTDVFESAKGVGRERDDVTGTRIHLRVPAVLAEREAPATGVHHEHLGGIMAVL